MDKHQKRQRRLKRTRSRIRKLGIVRLSVYRSNKHIYAQLISPGDHKVLASASTVEKEIKEQVKTGGNKEAAAVVGRVIADRAKNLNITEIAFDRSGYRYHGRVQTLAEVVREGGINF